MRMLPVGAWHAPWGVPGSGEKRPLGGEGDVPAGRDELPGVNTVPIATP
jgi:hypothetical protein